MPTGRANVDSSQSRTLCFRVLSKASIGRSVLPADRPTDKGDFESTKTGGAAEPSTLTEPLTVLSDKREKSPPRALSRFGGGLPSYDDPRTWNRGRRSRAADGYRCAVALRCPDRAPPGQRRVSAETDLREISLYCL